MDSIVMETIIEVGMPHPTIKLVAGSDPGHCNICQLSLVHRWRDEKLVVEMRGREMDSLIDALRAIRHHVPTA